MALCNPNDFILTLHDSIYLPNFMLIKFWYIFKTLLWDTHHIRQHFILISRLVTNLDRNVFQAAYFGRQQILHFIILARVRRPMVRHILNKTNDVYLKWVSL